MWALDETYLPESTQDQAASRILAAGPSGRLEPFGIFSGCQRTGRGSHGRQWVQADDGLALTCAWPSPDQTAAGVEVPWPLHVSGVVLRALEAELGAMPNLQIKWPNDL